MSEREERPQRLVKRYDEDVMLVGWGNIVAPADPVRAAKGQRIEMPLTCGEVKRLPGHDGTIEIVPGGQDIFLHFDFGRPVSGFIELCTEGENDGATVALVESWGYEYSMSGICIGSGDRMSLRNGMTAFQGSAKRSFQYLCLVLENLRSPLVIHSVGLARVTTHPLARPGSFACSDWRLNRVWEVGLDSIKIGRDRLLSRDPIKNGVVGATGLIGLACCAGDFDCYRPIVRNPFKSGVGADKLAVNAISGWVEVLWADCMLVSDQSTIEEFLPVIVDSLTRLAESAGGPDGLIARSSVIPRTNTPPRPPKSKAITNIRYVTALRRLAALAGWTERDDIADDFSGRADRIEKALFDHFWDSDRYVLVDALVNGRRQDSFSEDIISTAINSGIGSAAQQEALATRLLAAPKLLTWDGYDHVNRLSRAYCRIGEHARALDLIREHIGPTSSGGAAVLLLTEILGVTSGAPGFTQARIAPKPAGLRWARGVVPIPSGGDIVCCWADNKDRFTLNITVPVGTLMQVVLPAAPDDELIMDGVPLTVDQIVRRTETEAELCVMPGSGYRFEVVRIPSPASGGKWARVRALRVLGSNPGQRTLAADASGAEVSQMSGQADYPEFAEYLKALDGIKSDLADRDDIIVARVVKRAADNLSQQIDSLVASQVALGRSREDAIQFAIGEIGPPERLILDVTAECLARTEQYREVLTKHKRVGRHDRRCVAVGEGKG